MTLPPLSFITPTLFGRGNLRITLRGNKKSILMVALSRPRVKNAFSSDMYLDLIDVLNAAESDDSISALVLTGDGSYFTSGADLREDHFQNISRPRDSLNKPSGRFMMTLLSFPKLLAAAVHGPVVGIGVPMMFHFDLCYCAPQATFWAPFTRLALVPEFCSSVVFVETMGLPKANELLMLGKKIDALTAVQWNICSRVVEGCDSSGDSFHEDSLGSYMCQEIDNRLLTLPRGDRTAQVFAGMVRLRRKARLQQICRKELQMLDQRFDSGECSEAVSQLQIGSRKMQSKL